VTNELWIVFIEPRLMRVLDYARVYTTVALVAGSHPCIGLGVRLLRWSRAASDLPFGVIRALRSRTFRLGKIREQ